MIIGDNASRVGPKAGYNYSIDPTTGKERFSKPGGMDIGLDLSSPPKQPNMSVETAPQASPAPINYYGTAPKTAQADVTSGVVKASATAAAKATPEERSAAAAESYNNLQKGLAVAGFVTDVINANTAYQAADGQAQMNIMMARNEASDAISRGRQAQLDRQSEGYNAGQDSLIAMAAQGQSTSGGGAKKLQGSYEAVGYMNGARELINSYREALGYKLEEINYDYQVDNAAIARDNAIFGSALNAGVTLAVL